MLRADANRSLFELGETVVVEKHARGSVDIGEGAAQAVSVSRFPQSPSIYALLRLAMLGQHTGSNLVHLQRQPISDRLRKSEIYAQH